MRLTPRSLPVSPPKDVALKTLLLYLWPLPWTLLGLSLGVMWGGRVQRVDGVWEFSGPAIAWVLRRLWIPAVAITVGHVVLGRDRRSLDATRDHERVHVRQYERWGVLFVPAYLICSVYLYAQGRDGYRENPFEIEAYAVDDCRVATPARRTPQ